VTETPAGFRVHAPEVGHRVVSEAVRGRRTLSQAVRQVRYVGGVVV